ncbi:MAG: hemolysin III family protein [Planctomycetota bacterium]|jgi:hemolysin III|nr:hemolysin III family protein [Planctomycetota bacterium]MDP6764260.1 hemolysin III family protein [Planctomycetota bacterium]MDP6990418.1 hemolysin III family protein [Planctomycetota bacterium]
METRHEQQAVIVERYTRGEEIAHGVTHGVGALLSVAGLTLLVTLTILREDTWAIVGCSIFGATLVVLYTASTLYHSILSPRINHALRILDHAAIYLLIAGTYTPFMLHVRGPWGWSLFGLVWALAIAGVVFKVASPRRFREASLASYVFLGWLAVACLPLLVEHLDSPGLKLLLAGGLAYTGGVVFYSWRSLPYHHAIWHLCVLLGSALHFFSVLSLVQAR